MTSARTLFRGAWRHLALAAVGTTLIAAPAAAQDDTAWPAKSITWLVGFSAGGSVDVLSRLVADRLEKNLGQSVLVDNRPGARGAIALRAAADAEADGYTVITVPGPILSTQPLPEIGQELEALAMLGQGPMAIVGPAESAVADMSAVIEDARENPMAWSYASSGVGTSQHLAGELLGQMTGAQFNHIPYKGGGQAVADVAGGHVELAILGVPPVLPHVTSGRLKAYAVTTPFRTNALPDVPTLAETGVDDFAASQWFVMAAPAGVPARHAERLNRAVNDILADPEIQQAFENLGVVADPMSPTEATEFVVSDLQRWRDLIADLDLRLD